VALDEPEDVQEKKPALSAGAQAVELAASEPVASIQQEQVIATSDETASDESWLVHSSEPSRAIFGDALASRVQRITSGIDSWQREVWSSAQRLYTQGAERVDQAITRTRQFRAAKWTHLRERLSGAGAGAEDPRRVSPLTHPK
jgi:hypothetical protein